MLRSLRVRLLIVVLGVVALVLGASVAAVRHLLVVTLEARESPEAVASRATVEPGALRALEAGAPEIARSLGEDDGGQAALAAMRELHEETGCSLVLSRPGIGPMLVVPAVPGTEYSIEERGDALRVTLSRRAERGGRDEEQLLRRAVKLPLAVPDGPAPPGGTAGLAVLYALPPGALEPAPAPPQLERLSREARALDRRLVLVFAATGALLVALIVVSLVRVLRPVRELTAAAAALGAGDYSRRVDVRGDRELESLGRTFNAMAERLERNERLRRDLVADVAHELRTPLTNLRCEIEALEDGMAAPSPERLLSLREEVLLLARIVDDLQVLALADAGELRLEPAPLDVAHFVDQVARVARPAFDAGGVALEARVASRLPAVRADEGRLRQVLRNLLENARAHTPRGGTVTIEARAADGGLELAVSDSGEGIAPELLPRVFDRFVRGEPSRSRASGGSGLGLAIVKGLVEAHGGRVRAESVPGRGARITVTLPAVA